MAPFASGEIVMKLDRFMRSSSRRRGELARRSYPIFRSVKWVCLPSTVEVPSIFAAGPSSMLIFRTLFHNALRNFAGVVPTTRWNSVRWLEA